jgi:serine/threonine protein kinase
MESSRVHRVNSTSLKPFAHSACPLLLYWISEKSLRSRRDWRKFVTCPNKKELEAFSIGDVAGSRFVVIESHLLDCQVCLNALESLDNHADPIMRELSNTHPASNTLPDIKDEILSGIREAMQHSCGRASTDITLDSGRHFANLLEHGPCRVGRFELQEELGTGAFGYVFRAKDVELDRIVALKIQRAGHFAGDEEVDRFLREARSAASLTHPAIVSLFDTGRTEDGVCFLVTEYVEGETLEKRLAQDRFDFRTATELLSQLADALEYAHQHRVVHRDIKPSNIILDQDSSPHITDFGLAKREGGDPALTSDGRIMGTPAYMSPEQARGQQAAVDVRTDVYSLGVVFYELLTGERPFQGTKRLVLLQVLEDEPRPPRQLERRLPRDLETICLKAMSKTPTGRYQSAAALAEDLRRYLRSEPIEARPLGNLGRLWRWCRRYPLAASIFFAMTLGSTTGFFYLTQLSSYFVRETALDSARMEVDMLEVFNAYYSDALSRLDSDFLEITHEYAIKHNALPLPATFTIEAGERLGERETGMQLRLYSDYPFRDRGGPTDDFERKIIQILSTEVTQGVRGSETLEHHQFVTIDGQQYLKYARGQIMKQSCLNCHNTHAQSTKKDWKEGDLAGVLLLTRPLDRDILRTQSGLRSAFILMGAIAAALVLILVGFGFVATLGNKQHVHG